METDTLDPDDTAGRRTWLSRQAIGLWLGPLLAGLIQLAPVPESLVQARFQMDGIQAREAWIVLSLLVWMAIWWMSEAIPIPVTSLLPMVVLPLAGVLSIREASAPYMHPIVVLLMGGFIVAKAIERWNLHTRIALNIVVRLGQRPSFLIGGFMLAAAILSMWISNTATSIMMMPIALSVAAAVTGQGRSAPPFTVALLLGVAWACSIGGLGTPVGTPTNLIIIGYLNDNTELSIGFGQWMALGLPTVAILLPAAWFVLTKLAFKLPERDLKAGRALLSERLTGLGAMTSPEWRTLGFFAVIAGLWIFRQPLSALDVSPWVGGEAAIRPFGGLTDHVIAILGVFFCFLIPAGGKQHRGERLLNWTVAEQIPWGVLLLFGGGMSLATAITATGLSAWMGGQLGAFGSMPTVVLVAIIAALVIFLTEVTSNIATASALMPVLGSFALEAGLDVAIIAAPLAMAASCAFMLPMATGPNAVVFSSGKIELPVMARAGLWLNLVAIMLITAIAYSLVPIVF